MTDSAGAAPGRRAAGRLVPALAAVVLAAFLVAPPHSLAAKAKLIGYGVCHQEGERSYFVGGLQLPLCARDTGTYLGAIATLACMLAASTRRGTELPHPAVLVFYALAAVFFVVDGANSYADALPLVPRLYWPDNRLRLLSGLGLGSGISVVLLPLFNYTLWESAPKVRVLTGRALAAVPFALALAYLTVTRAPGWLGVPLSATLGLSVLLVLSAVNGLLIVVILRQDRLGTGWRDVVYLLSWGLLLSAAELGLLSLVRHFAERALL